MHAVAVAGGVGAGEALLALFISAVVVAAVWAIGLAGRRPKGAKTSEPPPGEPAMAPAAPDVGAQWQATVRELRQEWQTWREQLDGYAAFLGARPEGPEGDSAAVYAAMAGGLARSAGEGAALPGTPAEPAYWQGLFRAGTHRLIERDDAAAGAIRKPAHAAVGGDPDWASTLRRSLAQAGPLLAEAEGRSAELRGEVGRLSLQAEQIASATAGLREAARTVEAGSLDGRLAALLGDLETVATGLSAGDYERRLAGLGCMGAELRGEVAPLLAGAEPGDEALQYYRDTLDTVVRQLDRRLSDAADVAARPEDGLPPLEDVDVRLARLQARCRGLEAGGESYLREQARPLVQHHLRPIVDDLLRDFVTPLLAEARGDALLAAAAAAVKAVLARNGLEVLEPPAGAATLPEAPEGDEPYVLAEECEEVEVAAAEAEGARPSTIAAVLEPGYRWAGDVIARVRVRSYR